MTIDREEFGRLLALVVHDLRNPAATIGANAAYVSDVLADSEDEELKEAMSDVDVALSDLMAGLENVAIISRWLAGQSAPDSTEGELLASLASLTKKHPGLTIDASAELRARAPKGGQAVTRIVGILLSNSAQHARGAPPAIDGRLEADEVVLEVRDTGAAIAPELREAAFTMSGQQRIKGRADGRYGRVVGLFAARLLADSIGAVLESDGADGAAVFRLRFPAKP